MVEFFCHYLLQMLKANHIDTNRKLVSFNIKISICTWWHKKTGTFEKTNKNWRNPRKKIYWQKLNHYNLPF